MTEQDLVGVILVEVDRAGDFSQSKGAYFTHIVVLRNDEIFEGKTLFNKQICAYALTYGPSSMDYNSPIHRNP